MPIKGKLWIENTLYVIPRVHFTLGAGKVRVSVTSW